MISAAGAAKVAAGPQWPVQAAALGAPSLAVPIVPWFEMAHGALLCAQVARPLVGAVAAVTLLVFTGLIVRRLAEGKRPPCACFGSWSARPLGWQHIARNAVLLALAVVVIVR